MYFKTSDEVKINYEDEGLGPVIVFLTGFGGSKEIWHRQKLALIQHNYRVVTMDFRNQGVSQHVNWGLRVSRLAADVHELCLLLKLTEIILVGNSMGGAVVYAYLSLYSSNQIKRVVVVDQSPKMINDHDWHFGFKGLNWQNFKQRLQQPLGSSTFKHIDDDTFILVKKVTESHPFDSRLDYELLINHAVQDWRDVLRRLSIPMLLVVGKQSPYFDYRFGFEVQKLNSKIRTKVVNESGHIVMAEQSEKFNQLLLEFLSE
ncbi:alpha/beta fold hydrolase [Pediococcus ethanolidurans]|uniref:Halo peroxidase n=1 Tax=Pediococcus ethanolidurans TaxID=319653 RepID=A0A0R2JWF0_9LACO|nr:alpha/beta hydrolase [Pediococcus ethanolidurans]KRN81433.1 halo peroxidase [Pediococcus ethanolidurans]GEN95899.1 alpha/beta hydrolase [Pediococcus ethanolidurans]SER88184.1 peroxiredoxin [Pediococcus ethanolidurans]